MNEQRLGFLFSDLPPVNLHRMTCVQLDASIRPERWPDRVPFALFINNGPKAPGKGPKALGKRPQQRVAGFINYQSFFKKQMAYFRHERLKYPIDIAANSLGDVVIADAEADRVFVFNFHAKDNLIAFKTEISFNDPYRVAISEKGVVYVMSETGHVSCFTIEGVSSKVRFSSLLSSVLAKSGKVLDMTLNRYGELAVLTDAYLLSFSRHGRMLAKQPNESTAVALDGTIYGDLLVLADNYLEKYSRQLKKLDRYALSNFNDPPHLISVYKPYGYVGVALSDNGQYFGMNVDILNPSVTQLDTHLYHINFTTTLPSYITIYLLNKNGFRVDTISKKHFFASGEHSYLWDVSSLLDKGERIENYQIKVQGKGAYSIANTTSVTFQ